MSTSAVTPTFLPAAASQQHDYQDCADPDCPRFACRVYREGYCDGHAAGAAEGYAAGYAEGYCDAAAEG